MDNRLTADEYRELIFLVTYADLGRRVRHSEHRKIKGQTSKSTINSRRQGGA